MQSQKLQIQHISVIPYDEEEQKHHDFSNLHKDLVTLRQLQKDVSELVGEQGEDLNVAVLNTEKTHEESIKAGYELKKAAKTQAKG